MIVFIYKESGNTLTRLASAVVGENRQAVFTANIDWEITHYGVAEVTDGPLMLCRLPLDRPVLVEAGTALTIDLTNVTFEFRDNRSNMQTFSYEVGQWMLN